MPRKVPFRACLYEVDYIDFLGHFFDFERPGGFITGAHLVSGNTAPLAFEVDWPLGITNPPNHFAIFQDALDNVLKRARLLPIKKANYVNPVAIGAPSRAANRKRA